MMATTSILTQACASHVSACFHPSQRQRHPNHVVPACHRYKRSAVYIIYRRQYLFPPRFVQRAKTCPDDSVLTLVLTAKTLLTYEGRQALPWQLQACRFDPMLIFGKASIEPGSQTPPKSCHPEVSAGNMKELGDVLTMSQKVRANL
jgi:hypothetical protein